MWFIDTKNLVKIICDESVVLKDDKYEGSGPVMDIDAADNILVLLWPGLSKMPGSYTFLGMSRLSFSSFPFTFSNSKQTPKK